jgi:hypothetical protein
MHIVVVTQLKERSETGKATGRINGKHNLTHMVKHYERSCGKRRFPNLKEASDSLTKIMLSNDVRRKGKPKSYYKCPDCLGYHLTSQSYVKQLEMVKDMLRKLPKLPLQSVTNIS